MRNLITLATILLLTPPAQADVETFTLFNPALGETPESIQIDKQGDFVVSLALTGELRRITRGGAHQTIAFLPLAPEVQPCGNAFGGAIMGGVALDPQDNAYVSVASCDPARIGVYRVTPAGVVTQLAALGAASLPNGIAYKAGVLYVADTNLGRVWRIAADGATVWAEHSLLTPLPDFFPGPNGLQIFHDEIYVSVSDRAHIVAFPILEDGSAGTPRVHATGVGLDDFAFDVNGDIYGTTDPFNTLVRVSPGALPVVLLTDADGLDGPTAAVFGRREGDNQNLYVTNAAFPFFSTTFRPSILRVAIGVPGKPR